MSVVVDPVSSGSLVSSDIRLALAPIAQYRDLIASRHQVTLWRTLARPALVLLVIGTMVPSMVAHQIGALQMLAAAASWGGLVVAVQLATASLLILSAPGRQVRFARALDLWFAGHVPYTLWLLASGLFVTVTQRSPLDLLLLAAVAPLIWTVLIAVAFCQVVLGTSVAGARRRVIAHQLGTWLFAFGYVVWSAGGIVSVVSFVLRRLGQA